MKANAPEKLYLHPTVKGKVGASWLTFPLTNEDIEYTRTDTFIEKAAEYFHRSLEDTKVIDDYRSTLVRGIQASYTSVEEFIEDFKNYMKGE